LSQQIIFAYVLILIVVVWKMYISQGSAGTQRRCGEMFSNHVIANFSQNVPVKEFWKWSVYLAKIWTVT